MGQAHQRAIRRVRRLSSPRRRPSGRDKAPDDRCVCDSHHRPKNPSARSGILQELSLLLEYCLGSSCSIPIDLRSKLGRSDNNGGLSYWAGIKERGKDVYPSRPHHSLPAYYLFTGPGLFSLLHAKIRPCSASGRVHANSIVSPVSVISWNPRSISIVFYDPVSSYPPNSDLISRPTLFPFGPNTSWECLTRRRPADHRPRQRQPRPTSAGDPHSISRRIQAPGPFFLDLPRT